MAGELSLEEVEAIKRMVGPAPVDQNDYHCWVTDLHAAGNAVMMLRRLGARVDLSPAAPAQVSLHDELVAALKAVISVADRKTVEFDMARAAIAKAEGR